MHDSVATILIATVVASVLAADQPVRSQQVIVRSVKPGSQASRVGLQVGDRIAALDGEEAPSLEDLLACEFDTAWVRECRLGVIRNGQILDVQLPQGGWAVAFGPDFAEGDLKALSEARGLLAKDETWVEGQKRWMEMESRVRQAGFPNTAAWLCLERGKALGVVGRILESEQALQIVEASTPLGNPLAIAALVQHARLLQASGSADRAAAMLRNAVALDPRAEHPIRTARLTLILAGTESLRGQLSVAKTLAESALDLLQRKAPESVGLAEAWQSLGDVLSAQGAFSLAKTHMLKALALREHLLPDSMEVAASLNNLANLEWTQGNYVEAKQNYSRSLTIRRQRAPESMEVAASLNNLGSLVLSQGDQKAAKELFEKSFEIRQRLAPDGRDVATSLSNLGLVARNEGDLAKADRLFRQTYAIRQRLAPASLDLTRSLNALGAVAIQRGDLGGARAQFLEALNLRQRLAPSSPEIGSLLDNLGGVALQQGDFEAARTYYGQALEHYRRLGVGELAQVAPLIGLGSSVSRNGDLTAAREFYNCAYRIQERLSPEGPHADRTLQVLAQICMKQGDFDGAQSFLEKASKILVKNASGGLFSAQILQTQGDLALLRGKPADAVILYRQALSSGARLAPDSHETAEILHGLGMGYLALGSMPEALAFLSQAVNTLERQRAKVGGEHARSLFGALSGDFYLDLMNAQMKTGRIDRALETMERSRSRTLLEMVSSRYIDLKGEVPETLLERRRELATRRKTLSDNLEAADVKTDSKDLDAWRSELFVLPQQEDSLAEQIREASPRLAALEYPKPLNFHSMRQTLDPGTLLLAYCTRDTETYLFALSQKPGSLRAFRLPVGRKDLEKKIQALRAQMTPGKTLGAGKDDWKTAARDLYSVLLGPLTKELAVHPRILLMPDGPLHLLPFGVLLPKGGQGLNVRKPLGLQRSICTEPSLTVYAELKARRHSPVVSKGWVGFGDPSYEVIENGRGLRGQLASLTRNGQALGALPGTREEVKTIAGLFGEKGRAYLGQEATEEAVWNLPKGMPFIHFACHGLVDPLFPMNSALVLSLSKPEAGVQDHSKDGLLQAWEIIQDLRLDSDCVVLSACDTGLGQDQGGEGILGLMRAFFYAGARSLVVSQWAISDESTAQFMGAYYKEILAGRPRDLALQRAKFKLYASKDYAHPFHWAAFELHGRAE